MEVQPKLTFKNTIIPYFSELGKRLKYSLRLKHKNTSLESKENYVRSWVHCWKLGEFTEKKACHMLNYQGACGGTGGEYYPIVFFICAFVFWSPMSHLFFKWAEHDNCCVSFFLDYLFSLSLVPLTRSYWGIEIVVSVM